ncbi:NnrS family protein [Hydrogenophaga sp.]|uniref:NnrS family protein n=1 Tax=Hydrogenophaga sp. TaxID=1904254 RepID=UPI003565D696
MKPTPLSKPVIPLRQVRAGASIPAGAPAVDRRWRVAMLVQAPHRFGFFLAVLVLGFAAGWWALVQLDRVGFGPGLAYALSPTVVHAAVMSLGFMPLFFAGFLFTAGPKWLGVAPPPARAMWWPLSLQAAGWLVWVVGGHVSAGLAYAGAACAWIGMLITQMLFWRLLRQSQASDQLHARVVGVAGLVGCASLAVMLLALVLGAYPVARAAVFTGLWGFVVVTYVAVAHRMIPFFTSSAMPMVQAWRPFWLLGVLLAAAVFEALAAWGEVAGWPSTRGWMLARGLLELAAGSVILWVAFAWGLVQSLRQRLLAMLHLGFVWFGLAFVLAGLSQLLGLRTGVPVLGLGALHALTMGFLGSLILAMVTRVSCGHSGRALVADQLVWTLFWLLQAATVLRIVADLPVAPAGSLALAAVLFAVVVLVWGARLANWYGRARADGRPG